MIDYLGEHTIAKKIIAPASVFVEIVEEDCDLEVEINNLELDTYERDKEDWIFICGSDLLQQSVIYGYDSTDRYVRERLAIEYPGYNFVDKSDYQKADSPPEHCLQACSNENDSYCSHNKYYPDSYYVTVDDYLGKYQIIKEIIPSPETIIFNPRQKQQSKHLARKIFVTIASISFVAFGVYNCVFSYQSQRSSIPPTAKRLELEEKLIYLRATRLGDAPILYNRNLSIEERRKEVEKDLTSLRIERSSIDREIELNRKLIKELKPKRNRLKA